MVEISHQQTELGTPSSGECFPALLVLEAVNACGGTTAHGEEARQRTLQTLSRLRFAAGPAYLFRGLSLPSFGPPI